MPSEPSLRLVHSGEPTDVDALLGKVSVGDQAAFAQLYDALGAAVFGLARRVVRDPARAEDVAQEVFLEVWRKAPSFNQGRGSGKTWVMTIAHRRAVDAVRRSEAQKKYEGRAVVDDVQQDETADTVITNEEHEDVRTCMETLTELQLESVRLAYFKGYTYNEVARLLRKPLPTIKTRMRDGLIRLRDCLEESR
jgi:RNA polymerase sigma-70 factor (ECF subfamily)